MDGPLTTATDAAALARLTLFQWLSPAFPTGAFAYSSGLETAMADGRVGRDNLADWLADWLEYGGGWSDAVLLALALRDDADLLALDDLARALCLSFERLTETLDQGSAFAATQSALSGREHPPATLPVAVGRAARDLPLPHPEIIALYLHGVAANLTHAAVRFLPMGQVQAQTLLAALHPLIADMARRASVATIDDTGTATLGADIAAMHHETLETRIFRT